MDLASAISSQLRDIEMDFKFDLDSKSSSKKSAKKGRKSLPFGLSLSSKDETLSETPDPSEKGVSSPPKSRRSGGWASDTLKSAIRRSSSALFEQEELDNRMTEDDIPVIPNLDDLDDDKIAKAPMLGHRVATYKELEIDLLKHSAFSSLEDVNLRVLTTYIQNPQALDEPDVPWTTDSLFADLISYNNTLQNKAE